MRAQQGAGIHRLVDAATLPGDIALGPDHPTLDGLPSVRLDVADGVVTSAEWIPGSVHRGAEKLFESRDYRQILMLVDRHDWLSAFCSEIGVVVGVERALGLTPPERAQHLRILLCELTRIAHHLAFLAPLPGALPDAWRARAWAWRAEILDLIEAATGQRVHPMFCQVGGVRADVDAEWVQWRGRCGRSLGRPGARRRPHGDRRPGAGRPARLVLRRCRGPQRRAGPGLRRIRPSRPGQRGRPRPATGRPLPALPPVRGADGHRRRCPCAHPGAGR